MNMWKKIKSIRIPGDIWSPLLVVPLLATTMVLFTRLPVAPPTVRTSEESISGKNESLEIIIVLPDGEELRLKATGRTTMEVLTNLRQMLKGMDGNLLLERSSHSIRPLGVSTMRRPASSSFIMF
jgi:hypothetical protein